MFICSDKNLHTMKKPALLLIGTGLLVAGLLSGCVRTKDWLCECNVSVREETAQGVTITDTRYESLVIQNESRKSAEAICNQFQEARTKWYRENWCFDDSPVCDVNASCSTQEIRR